MAICGDEAERCRGPGSDRGLGGWRRWLSISGRWLDGQAQLHDDDEEEELDEMDVCGCR